jgi:hypothetical protein
MKDFLILAGKTANDIRGYKEVVLRKSDGHQIRRGVHAIICATFHGPKPTSTHQAAHNDGNKLNNRADNLRWATPKENAGDRERHGTNVKGVSNWKTTLTEDDVRAIRAEYRGGYGGYTPLRERYGLTRGAIYRIVKRKNWKHI